MPNKIELTAAQFASLEFLIAKKEENPFFITDIVNDAENATQNVINAAHNVINATHNVINATHNIVNDAHNAINVTHNVINATQNIINATNHVINTANNFVVNHQALVTATEEIVTAIAGVSKIPTENVISQINLIKYVSLNQLVDLRKRAIQKPK